MGTSEPRRRERDGEGRGEDECGRLFGNVINLGRLYVCINCLMGDE